MHNLAYAGRDESNRSQRSTAGLSARICARLCALLCGRRSHQCSGRQGGAVVEFAVCLPVLMLLVVGSIEASSAIFLKQSLTAAAYEGVREASRLTATRASAESIATNVLAARQIKGFSVTLSPNDPTQVKRGDRVVVEVSASISSNSPMIGSVVKDRRLVTRSVMVKE